MQTVSTFKNWEIATSPLVLGSVHQKDINIAIYERDINMLFHEIRSLLEKNIELKAHGDVKTILNEIAKTLHPDTFKFIFQDIKQLLGFFENVTLSESFRLLLATVNTNMCRKFHTDINDLRMLCTYSGPGTLWLTEDNVNRTALEDCAHNECIVLDEKRIRQVATGSVVILKGSIYPVEETKAIVHRSPTIEESGAKRLLLRIDTNEFLKDDT